MMHLAGALRVVVRGREIESCVHVGGAVVEAPARLCEKSHAIQILAL
jgi:hypothetical protein